MRSFKQIDFVIDGQIKRLVNNSIFFDGSFGHKFGTHASGVLAFRYARLRRAWLYGTHASGVLALRYARLWRAGLH